MTNTIDDAGFREFLTQRYTIHALTLAPLAHGEKQVYRVRRADGPDCVVRLYRPDGFQGDAETVAGLAEVLLFLERQEYPAERVFTAVDGSPVVQYGDQQALVTTFVGETLRPWQPGTGQPAQQATGAEDALSPETFFAVGAALGRLHALPMSADQPLRRAGMLPKRELSWVAGKLAALAGRLAGHWQADYDTLVTAVQKMDYGEDLPAALIHNDPNLGNVVQTPTGEIVLIDWDCAGLGPAVLDLGILLRNCYVKSERRINQAAVLAVVDGYSQYRRLTPAEVEQLPAMIRFMTLVLLAACFPGLANGLLAEDDLLYGATYGAWQAQYAASDQIAALARARLKEPSA
jgi:Ser/Thr protein kinase RdoA (MazF antagonist)